MCKIPAHFPSPWCSDRRRVLSLKGQLVSSGLCGPEHIASFGMMPCCFGTVSLGPCWQPPSHSNTRHQQPQAPEQHQGLKSPIIQPCEAPHTVPSSPHPQSQPRQLSQKAARRVCSGTLTKLGNPNTLPKPIWQWKQAEGTAAPPMSKWQQSLHKQNRMKQGEAPGHQERDTQSQQGSDMLREEHPISPAQG